MRRIVPWALAVPVLLFLSVSACDEDAPPNLTEPVVSQSVPAVAAVEARANVLITELFPPRLRQAASRFFVDLKRASARGDAAAAGATLVEFIAFALVELEAGNLSEPDGDLTIEEGLAELFDALVEVGGFDAVGFDPGVLDGSVDGEIAVVTASSSDTTIVTAEEFAGTTIPAGAVDEPVVIAIQRRTGLDTADCLPLPAGVAQFEGCYQFNVIPDQDFGTDVVVGVCLEDGPDIDQLSLHKFRPEEPELGVKPLPAAQAPFLDCSDFTTLAHAERGPLTRLAMRSLDAFARAVLPRPLRAAHNGAGGLTINFSHVGWAEDNLLAWDSDRAGAAPGLADIFTSSSDGGHVINLTGDPQSLDANPKWSPDGSRIAFRSTRTGDPEVWIMNADGSGPVQVTNVPGFDNPHSWHPNGDSLTVTSDSATVNRGVFVMAADGSTRRLVIDSAGSGTWSPDGSRIAVEHVDPLTGILQIFLVDPDGTNRVRLTSSGANARPTWSPDGSRIAFASTRDGNTEIYVMNSDGSNQVNITEDLAFDSEPAWSRDGGRIAFESNRDGNLEIYLVDPDGGDPRRVTVDPGVDNNPDWLR